MEHVISFKTNLSGYFASLPLLHPCLPKGAPHELPSLLSAGKKLTLLKWARTGVFLLVAVCANEILSGRFGSGHAGLPGS